MSARPWQLYNALLSAQSLGVMDRLFFGSGFPYEQPAKAIENLYSVNTFAHGTQLPSIPRVALRAIAERDPFSILSALHAKQQRAKADKAPQELREPLATLGLGWPVTMEQLKARYHELAKRHHPDANNGDRGAEERLKVINLAYATLRGKLAAEPRMAAAG